MHVKNGPSSNAPAVLLASITTLGAFACHDYNIGQIGSELPGESTPAPVSRPRSPRFEDEIAELRKNGETERARTTGDLAAAGPWTLSLDADTCYRLVLHATAGGSFVRGRFASLRFDTDAPDVVPAAQTALADGASIGFCSPEAHAAAKVGLVTHEPRAELAPQPLGSGPYEAVLYTDMRGRGPALEPTVLWNGRRLSLVSSVVGRCQHPPAIDVAAKPGACYLVSVWPGAASAWTADALDRGFRIRVAEPGRAAPSFLAADETSAAVGALYCRGSEGAATLTARAELEMKPRAEPLDGGDPNPRSILGAGRCTTAVYGDR